MSPPRGHAADHHIGIFASRAAAETAIHALIKAGYRSDEIGLFVQAAAKTHDGKIDEGIELGGEAGAALGAAAGGLSVVLAGFGLLAIPGVGPVLAVGPLAGALAGAITGSAIGGFTGSLVALGISESQAAAAEDHLRAGQALVLVRSTARGGEAAAMMNELGAIDVSGEGASGD
jgi:hypothetical protein